MLEQDILNMVFTGGVTLSVKKFDSGKTTLIIILVNLSQVALIAAVLLYLVEMGMGAELLFDPWIVMLLVVIAAAVIISSITAFRSRIGFVRKGNEFRLLQDTLARLENLNTTLRGQRHDFMNHLQVVHSLIEMEEYGSASEYIETVYDDIQKVSKIMKTSVAAVNALLQAKLMACEKHGISVELDVRTQLKDLKIPSWEFCRVLGNLIDNAIYALNNDGNHKSLKIMIYEDLKSHCFKVMDDGETSPDKLSSRIFEPGFTTKDDMGEGMGLAICKRVVDSIGGSIGVSRVDGWTVFEGSIPR